MTRRARTHFAERATGAGTMTLCGMLRPASAATRDRDAVTCRLCTGRLSELPFDPPTPWTPPPERAAQPGARHLSDDDREAIADSRRGERRRPLFGSMGQALEALVTARIDGYSGGSVSGSYEALGAMGTLIQHERRGSTSTTRQAEGVAEVDKALRFVFAGWRGAELDERQARAAFLLMEVGRPIVDRSRRRSGGREWTPRGGWRAWTPLKAGELAAESGVSVNALGSLRKWARRRMRVELCARTLLAMPHRPVVAEDPERFDARMSRYVREMGAIEVRQKELGR